MFSLSSLERHRNMRNEFGRPFFRPLTSFTANFVRHRNFASLLSDRGRCDQNSQAALKETWGEFQSTVTCVDAVHLFPHCRGGGRQDVCRFGRVKNGDCGRVSLFSRLPCYVPSLVLRPSVDLLISSVFGLSRLKISSEFAGDSVKNSRSGL